MCDRGAARAGNSNCSAYFGYRTKCLVFSSSMELRAVAAEALRAPNAPGGRPNFELALPICGRSQPAKVAPNSLSASLLAWFVATLLAAQSGAAALQLVEQTASTSIVLPSYVAAIQVTTASERQLVGHALCVAVIFKGCRSELAFAGLKHLTATINRRRRAAANVWDSSIDVQGANCAAAVGRIKRVRTSSPRPRRHTAIRPWLLHVSIPTPLAASRVRAARW